MGWARMDDAFDDHEKVLALLDLDEGVAAVGLWTLCWTYAHRNTRKKGKTPGLLPATLPRRFAGASGKTLASLLVKVGLWDELDEGWMIHDFADYLPDKEVSSARSAAGKKGAASRWGNRQTNGNLPSVDGKSDGKPVAGDGASEFAKTPEASVPAERNPYMQSDGNEPSGDGNLPSAGHSGNSKAVASDGSRAGAHRVRVDVRTSVLFPEPGPEPIPPSAGTTEPSHATSAPASAEMTITQRSKRITDAYANAEPLCKWPAVNAIVLKAIRAGKWTDEQIQDALLRLVDNNRGVTVETLRRELAPPAQQSGRGSQSRNAQIIDAAMQRAIAAEQAEAARQQPPRGAISA